MDAGVFQLSVFPHQDGPARQRLIADGEEITPDLKGRGAGGSSGDVVSGVSLIVPTFFNRHLKRRSLEHLLSGIERSAAVREVVIVASGSTDIEDLQDGFREFSVPIQFVTCGMNQRAHSRNAGAAAATSDLLLFLDDDMLLHDWSAVDDIVSEMKSGRHDCALFPRRQYLRFPWLYDEPEAAQKIAEWRSDPEAAHEEKDIYDPVRHGCAQPLVSFCFPGCFMLISKEAYQRVGGFPEEFEGWGFEDTQFAMQAMARLSILNLFRRSCALLHIDHPVSPYKSAEYQENLERFRRTYRSWDVAKMTREVISGGNLSVVTESHQNLDELMKPLKAAGAELPFEFPTHSVRKNFTHIVDSRLDRGFSPDPQWIVLHGSRGRGTARPDSDYDLLVLFDRGISCDFFVSRMNDGSSVEIEYSDCARFEQLAAEPAYSPLACPLEISKLAQARVLFGDADAFQEWAQEQMARAVKFGRAIWFLQLLWMQLNPGRNSGSQVRLADSMEAVFLALDPEAYARDLKQIRSDDSRRLRSFVLDILDEDVNGWRIDMAEHKRVFAYQAPELWNALTWLVAS